jgi:hypothetical protein
LKAFLFRIRDGKILGCGSGIKIPDLGKVSLSSPPPQYYRYLVLTNKITVEPGTGWAPFNSNLNPFVFSFQTVNIKYIAGGRQNETITDHVQKMTSCKNIPVPTKNIHVSEYCRPVFLIRIRIGSA